MSEKTIVEYHFYEERKGELETPEGQWVQWAAGWRSQCLPGEHGKPRLLVSVEGANFDLIKRLMLDAKAVFKGHVGPHDPLVNEFLLEREVPTVKSVHFLHDKKGFVDVIYNPEVVRAKVERPYINRIYEKKKQR